MTINFEISEESYKLFNSIPTINNNMQVLSVPRVHLPQGRSLTVIQPSDTERNCTLATSNIVSSQVLSAANSSQALYSPPPSPTKLKRLTQISTSSSQTVNQDRTSPQISSSSTQPIKGQPALIDYAPQYLALLKINFNLSAVVETKFIRTLNTALLMIIAAYKTRCIPKQETTRLQFGCGFGGFEGLHSSLIPEPSFGFESHAFQSYVKEFASNWIHEMETALEKFSSAKDSKDSYKFLEQVLFGPDLQLLLIFFNQEIAKDLHKAILEYINSIRCKQTSFISFLKNDLKENIKEHFSTEDILYIKHKLTNLKNALDRALSDSIISPVGNMLNDSHFHYSCNAIDVLPDAFNQFDTLIENEMRNELLKAISLSANDKANNLDQICQNFIDELSGCLKQTTSRITRDLPAIKRISDYQTQLKETEKQLQLQLEKVVKQLKDEEKDKVIKYCTRLKNFRDAHTKIVHLYFAYILQLKSLSDELHGIFSKKSHAQVSQVKNFLEESTRDPKNILEGFYSSLFDQNIWFELQTTAHDPLTFLKLKFEFLTQDLVLSEAEAKNKLRLLTEHFKRLNDAIKAKLNQTDPERIIELNQDQKEFYKKETANNSLLAPLLQSSFLLLKQKTCPKNIGEQIHNLCQSFVELALTEDCGLITQFISKPYIRYVGYLPSGITLHPRSELEFSTCYLDNIIDPKTPADDYLKQLNLFLDRHLEPLSADPSIESRLSIAKELTTLLSQHSTSAVDTYPQLAKDSSQNPRLFELAENMAQYSLTLPPDKKPSTLEDYSFRLNSYIRITYTAAKLKERLDFALQIAKFLNQVISDENIMPRVITESQKIINLFTVRDVASGRFFVDFSRLVNLPKDFPGTEGPRIQSMGLFLQFALANTNSFTYAGIQGIEDMIAKIQGDTLKSLQPKEENKFSIFESFLKLDFLCQHGIPTYLQILKRYSPTHLKDMATAEIPVSEEKKNLDFSKLNMLALKQQPLSQLAPWLFASMISNKHILHKSSLRQVRVADKMFSGIQDRFISNIVYDSLSKIYSISIPQSYSKHNKLSTKEIAYKIYEIIKDIKLESKLEKIAFDVEVNIDYFTH